MHLLIAILRERHAGQMFTLPNLLICSAVFFSPLWALDQSVSDSL